MTDIKKLNSDLQETVPFPTKLTSSFPITFQFGGYFAARITDHFTLGLIYAYNSTGSRVASGDYSGTYYFDNILTGHSFGLLSGYRVYQHKSLRVDLQANLGVVITNMEMKEDLHVADTSISSSYQYSSTGFYAEPRCEASYSWKYLKAGLYLGYYLNAAGKLQTDEGQKTTTTTNWSGIRFGILIGIHQAGY